MRSIIFSNGEEVEITETSNHNDLAIRCSTFDDAVDVAKQYSAYDWDSFTIKRVELRDTKEFPYSGFTLDHYTVGNDEAGFFAKFNPRKMTDEELYRTAFGILLEGE